MSIQTTEIPIEILLIEDDGSHLLLQATINGKVARLLIDTGASRTVFDSIRIKDFVNDLSFELHDKLSTGLGTDSMPTSVVTIDSFNLGKLAIKKFNGVILDLKHVNGTYDKLGHSAIDGVLGNDVLLAYNAIINYEKKILILKSPTEDR